MKLPAPESLLPSRPERQQEYFRVTQEGKVSWVYSHLNILDSKASALLRYNGIILAIVALFLFRPDPLSPDVAWQIALAALSLPTFVAFAFSAFLCLRVVGLFWYENFEDSAEAERARLSDGFSIINWRTKWYRRAWKASTVGTLLFALLLFVILAQNFYVAW